MNIGFIGIGKLGLDVAQVMSETHNVEGYDINEISNAGFPIKNNLRELCDNKELIFIAVPTPHDPLYDGKQPTSHLPPKDFNYDTVKEILKELNDYCTKDQLIVLISTVLPGTTRKEFIPLVENYRFIYNPYLIAMGTVKYDFVNPEMVIIGTEDGSETTDAKILVDFYKTVITPNARYEIGTWDEAESIKIFYNTFISVKISVVNMIQDVAEKNGNIDTDVVTRALERSTYRVTGPAYMKAGMGDGGSCHPRDNIALRHMAKEYDLGYDLFDAIMRSREVQAKNVASKLTDLSNQHKLPIVIMGESYKPGVPYTDGSYTKLISHYLGEVVFDKIEGAAVYLLGHRGVFNDTLFPKGSVILDPWRERNNNDTIYYGNRKK